MTGVTIVTCTHIPYYRENIFNNYSRQNYRNKELIIILNNTALDIFDWKKCAVNYQNVILFQMPEQVTVGSCMNFAVRQARYDYIANFDHDDYYGAEYLNDFMNAAPRTDAGLFGKKTHYVYLEKDGTLALMHSGFENRYVDYVDGPTMFMKKNIFNKVKFIDNDTSDCQLSWDCRSKGIRIYSVNRRHFAYIRKKDINLHTWKIENKDLIDIHCTIIGKMQDYRPYVDMNQYR